jgi:hypothetical protein
MSLQFLRFRAPLAVLCLTVCCTGLPALAQERHEDARGLIQRITDDLQRVRNLGDRNHKEKERVDNALKHLSDFDRNWTRHNFNQGRLDSAIDDIKNVVKNNTLEPRDRDMLTADMRDLREFRWVETTK